MKLITTFFLSLFLLTPALAKSETLQHRVLDGRFHKDGSLSIKKHGARGNDFLVDIHYKLKPTLVGRVFKKFMTGSYRLSFPESMTVEQGYYDLRNNGPVDIADGDKVATIKYIKQLDIDGYQGAHKVEIRSKSTVGPGYPGGKWHMFLYYHPGVLSLGVFRAEIFYHGKYSYEIFSKLR